MIPLKQPEHGAVVSLLTETQKNFLASCRSQNNAGEIDYLDLKKETNDDCSFPKTVHFEWEGEAVLQISETECFDECLCLTGNGFCDVDNLKCGTQYFWRVVKKNDRSEVRSFKTEDCYPRMIRIDGLTNVRDCGGRITADGKRMKQGMLYRGSEMNSHVQITEKGLRTMRDVLNITSVLDLRCSDEEVQDVYGGNYRNIPAVPYSEWFTKPEFTKGIFEFLCDEANYPIYFHCWGGADRTGTAAFLVEALLGQTYEDLIDDYEITTLSVWGVRSRNSEHLCKPFLEEFNRMEGNTPAEKAEHHFLSCGVTKESIARFRRLMLEEKEALQ